jgi:hypothetical protein
VHADGSTLLTWLTRYVEDITAKTGNYKKYAVFVKMLLTAITEESDSVFVDLLTYTVRALTRPSTELHLCGCPPVQEPPQSPLSPEQQAWRPVEAPEALGRGCVTSSTPNATSPPEDGRVSGVRPRPASAPRHGSGRVLGLTPPAAARPLSRALSRWWGRRQDLELLKTRKLRGAGATPGLTAPRPSGNNKRYLILTYAPAE